MKRNLILPALVEGGATIRLAQGYGPYGPHGLAAAEFAGGHFYWVELYFLSQLADGAPIRRIKPCARMFS